MTKEAARRLKKKCWRIAVEFANENQQMRLTQKIFALIRRETRV